MFSASTRTVKAHSKLDQQTASHVDRLDSRGEKANVYKQEKLILNVRLPTTKIELFKAGFNADLTCFSIGSRLDRYIMFFGALMMPHVSLSSLLATI